MNLKAKLGGTGQDEKVGGCSPCTWGQGQSQQNGGVPKDTPRVRGVHWSHSIQTFAEATVLQ